MRRWRAVRARPAAGALHPLIALVVLRSEHSRVGGDRTAIEIDRTGVEERVGRRAGV